MAKLNLEFINLLLVVLLSLVLLLNVFTLFGLNTVAKNPADVKDGIDVSLTAIEPTDCAKCPDLAQVIEAFKQSGSVSLKASEIIKDSSSEGRALIARYKITRLPAIILQGDVDELPDSPNVERVGDALLIRQLPPPYYDVEKKQVAGIVDVYLLTAPSCTQCNDIAALPQQLSMAGVAVGAVTNVSYTSTEGKQLMKKYNVTLVPAAVFSPDAAEYPVFQDAWPQAGSIEDGWYVLRALTPPYIDTVTGKVRGVVKATYVDDESCTTCYDPTLHKTIMSQNFGLNFANETTIDIASTEGKALVKKYNLTLVPTVILDGDLEPYAGLVQAWDTIGTTEKDGSMVFRQLDVLSDVTFKDLATGKLNK